MGFLDRLKQAAAEGVLLGVKVGLVVIVTLWAVSWLVGDYSIVRQRAYNGQLAFEHLQQQAQQPQVTK